MLPVIQPQCPQQVPGSRGTEENMTQALETGSWKHVPPERHAGETLADYILRRAARMRKVQALIAVYAEELEALEAGPEYDRILAEIRTLQDEEAHLRLRRGEERFRPGIVCFTFDEEIHAREPFPSLEVSVAQEDLGGRDGVCHRLIRQELELLQSRIAEADRLGLHHDLGWKGTEAWLRERWERALLDATEAREELAAQGRIRQKPNPTAAAAVALAHREREERAAAAEEFEQARKAVIVRRDAARAAGRDEDVRKLEDELEVLWCKRLCALRPGREIPARLLPQFDLYPDHPRLPADQARFAIAAVQPRSRQKPAPADGR